MFSWKEDLSAIAVIFNDGQIKNISNKLGLISSYFDLQEFWYRWIFNNIQSGIVIGLAIF